MHPSRGPGGFASSLLAIALLALPPGAGAQAGAGAEAQATPLAQRQPLKVGTFTDAYPYSYLDENGRAAGIHGGHPGCGRQGR